MSTGLDWAANSGDAWARRWREIDATLGDLAPKLDSALLEAAPPGPFAALDIGCGSGPTSEQLARTRPDAAIVACDISRSLAQIATDRLAGLENVRVILGDAETVAAAEAPFDLFFSRHGVMFFADPVRAFRAFRDAAKPGATMIFSCFQRWEANPWASELAPAAAGRALPPPGKEPSGFAFADPDHVRDILLSAGWSDPKVRSAPFRYFAGQGDDSVGQAMAFFTDIGPASRELQLLAEAERGGALDRMRRVVEKHRVGKAIEFPAAAWIWSAQVAEA